MKYLISLCLIIASVQAADIWSGLIGYWHLDEGSGISFSDASGNGLTGLVISGQWTDGKFGKGLIYDGSQYSKIPYKSILDTADQELTLACWVKSTSTNQNNYALILNRPSNNDSYYECYALQIRNGKWSGSVTVKPSADDFKPLDGPSSGKDIWRHLALTYDGKDMILYVDGKRAETLTINKGKIDYVQNFDLIVGANINHGSNIIDYFKGIVDELRIYSRALSADDIQALYSFDPTKNTLLFQH